MLKLQRALYRNYEKGVERIIQPILTNNMYAQQLLTIHDECGCEVIDKQPLVEKVIKLGNKALEIKDAFRVQLTVGCKWSRESWGTLKPIDKEPIPW